LDLQRALPVDLEQHVVAAGDPVLDAGARRAVEMAVDLGPLDELAAIDHRAKRLLVDEVVLTAVLVLAARLSGRVRDRQCQVRVELEECLDEARLARAARRSDCVEVARVFHVRSVYVPPRRRLARATIGVRFFAPRTPRRSRARRPGPTNRG